LCSPTAILAIVFSLLGHLYFRKGKTLTSTRLPQVDRILREQRLIVLGDRFRRELLTMLVREELARLRAAQKEATPEAIADAVAADAEALLMPALRKVINGTGVVLNTNLGRAPLSQAALSDLQELGTGYCNLEIDLDSGKRGKRSHRIQRLLQLITGAEAALVVNNNAAAVLLCVNALSKGKKVVVSRGELIEIGGSFRLPDVIEASGGVLCEVGTTNRTRIGDFKKAAGPDTGLFMRCHRSNFEIRGFTESVSLEELAKLAGETGIPMLEDLGSGILADLSKTGLAKEPTVQEVVASGCDLVSFSGDKLLGGPQAGFIVGKKSLVDKLQKHSIYRALRLDKLTLALIERTLIAYLSPQPQQYLPVIAMLHEPVEKLRKRAEQFAGTISDGTPHIQCRAIATMAAAGGGSLPGEELASFGIELDAKNVSATKLSDMLRHAATPVIAIIQNEKVILDFRTIAASDESLLRQAILDLAKRVG
jgi:L-seryl-tRNA(Ser) seleniumtransferase